MASFSPGPDVRYGPVTREQLIAKSIPLEKQFFALADRYVDSPDRAVSNLARALLMHFERFFTFLRKEGVANEQYRRACAPLRRPVAQDQFRKSQRRGRSGGGAPAHRYPHMPHAESRRARLSRRRRTITPHRATGTFIFIAQNGLNHLNCYE